MPVDNDLYDSLADSWWDEKGVLATLQALNPARFGYMRRVLAESRIDLRSRKTLDIGCGGGSLAEEFARLGCDVTGIDPLRGIDQRGAGARPARGIQDRIPRGDRRGPPLHRRRVRDRLLLRRPGARGRCAPRNL